MLASLKCPRIINCKNADIDLVLKDLFPEPIDIVWETQGGEMYKTLFEHLGVGGRMISLGATGDLLSDEKSDTSIINYHSQVFIQILKDLTFNAAHPFFAYFY